jgi:uracil-DNA glycosylase family protein
MPRVVLSRQTDWDGWRSATRALVLAGTPPEDIAWHVGPGRGDPLPADGGSFGVPRLLVALAAQAFQARDPARFDLLYRLVWRAQASEPVLELEDDAELTRARRLALAVRADGHRMRTHLRFLRQGEDGVLFYLGWYAPSHFVLEATARLLARRFPALPLVILTPDGSAHWDGRVLRFGAGLDGAAVPDDASLAAQWWDYRSDILATTRIGTPIPEAEELDEDPRPPDRPPLGPVVLPARVDPPLQEATAEAVGCRRCPLWEAATQTVFGEGPSDAALLFIGEQPGDQEDVIGRPFVGPAGQILDRALEEAGIDRRRIYITNAVKHFKFVPRGKRRIHQTPEAPELLACKPWLDAERVRLQPKLTVLMGATAASAVLERPVTIGRERGRPFPLANGGQGFITVHPSYLLRVPDEEAKAREYERFVAELREIARLGA